MHALGQMMGFPRQPRSGTLSTKVITMKSSLTLVLAAALTLVARLSLLAETAVTTSPANASFDLATWKATKGVALTRAEWSVDNPGPWLGYRSGSNVDCANSWYVSLGPLGMTTLLHDTAWSRKLVGFASAQPVELTDESGLLFNTIEVRNIHDLSPVTGFIQPGDMIFEIDGQRLMGGHNAVHNTIMDGTTKRQFQIHLGKLIDTAEGRGSIRLGFLRLPEELKGTPVTGSRQWTQHGTFELKANQSANINIPLGNAANLRWTTQTGGGKLTSSELRFVNSNGDWCPIIVEGYDEANSPFAPVVEIPNGNDWSIQGTLISSADRQIQLELLSPAQLPASYQPYFSEVEIPLDQLGSFGETYNPDSQKVSNVSAILAHRLALRQDPGGLWLDDSGYDNRMRSSIAALALMTTEDPQYDENVRRAALTLADASSSWTYPSGVMLHFLAEYYLRTQDQAILPGLKRQIKDVRRFITSDYIGGHKTHPGYGGKGWIGGGGQVALGLSTCAEAGLLDADDLNILDQMLTRAGEIAPGGKIPYNRASTSSSSNNHSGGAASGPYYIASLLRGGNKRFVDAATARYSNGRYGTEDYNHAVQTLHYLYSGLAISNISPELHRDFMSSSLWRFTIMRDHRGFINRNNYPLELHTGDNACGITSLRNAAYLLLINTHKRNLLCTGAPGFKTEANDISVVTNTDRSKFNATLGAWSVAEQVLGDSTPPSLLNALTSLRSFTPNDDFINQVGELIESTAPQIAADILALPEVPAGANRAMLAELVLGLAFDTFFDVDDDTETVDTYDFMVKPVTITSRPGLSASKRTLSNSYFQISNLSIRVTDPSSTILAAPLELQLTPTPDNNTELRTTFVTTQAADRVLQAEVSYEVMGMSISYTAPIRYPARQHRAPNMLLASHSIECGAIDDFSGDRVGIRLKMDSGQIIPTEYYKEDYGGISARILRGGRYRIEISPGSMWGMHFRDWEEITPSPRDVSFASVTGATNPEFASDGDLNTLINVSAGVPVIFEFAQARTIESFYLGNVTRTGSSKGITYQLEAEVADQWVSISTSSFSNLRPVELSTSNRYRFTSAYDATVGEIDFVSTASSAQMSPLPEGSSWFGSPAEYTTETSGYSNIAPIIFDAEFSLEENAHVGTLIGTPFYTDPNDNDTVSFRIIDSIDSALFTINLITGEISTLQALDFETSQQHSIVVEIADSNGAVDRANITISVTNLDDGEDFLVVTEDPNTFGYDPSTSHVGGNAQFLGFGVDLVNYHAGSAGSVIDPASIEGGSWTVLDSEDANISQGNLTATPSINHNDSGLNAWVVTDNSQAGSQFVSYSRTLDSAQKELLTNSVWHLSTQLRMVDDFGDSKSVILQYGDGTTRFLLFFDLDSNGDLVIETVGSGGESYTLTQNATGSAAFHRVSLIHDPATGKTAIIVDGVRLDTGNWTGQANTFSGIQWGTGSSGGRGQAAFHSVKLETYVSALTLPSDIQLNYANGEIGFNYLGDYLGMPSGENITDSFSYLIGDGQGGFTPRTLKLNILGQNDAPNVSGDDYSLSEETAIGTVVGEIIASDPDNGDSLSYAISGGNIGGVFSIDQNGQIYTALEPDFETWNQYQLVISASDTLGLTTSATFNIAIEDVIEPNDFLSRSRSTNTLWNRFNGNQIWNNNFLNSWNEDNGNGTRESLDGTYFVFDHSGSGASTVLSGQDARLSSDHYSWNNFHFKDWTFETKIKFDADPNGFAIWLGTGTDTIIVRFYSDRTEDEGGQSFRAYHNNLDNAFHTIRIAHDSNAQRYHLWRDDIRLTPLGGASYDNSSDDNRLLLGDTSGGTVGDNSIVSIAHIAIDQTGGYRPVNADYDSDKDGYLDSYELSQGSDPDDASSQPAKLVIAHWDFNDTSTLTKSIDSIGKNTGTLLDGASFSANGEGHTGLAGDHALDLGDTKASQRMETIDAAFLNAAASNNSLTICFRQKLDSLASSSSFWGVSPSSPSTRGIQSHGPWSDGSIYYDIAGNSTNNRTSVTPSNVIWSNWNHFAYVKKGPFTEIWMNGVLLATGSDKEELPTDFSSLIVGSGTSTNSIIGLIDDFTVFRDALSPRQITALANGASSLTVLQEYPPSLTNTSFDIVENLSPGSVVGNLGAQSQGASQVLNYMINGGNTGEMFTIDQLGNIRSVKPLDFETISRYTLDISVTDSDQLTNRSVVTISVSDALDPQLRSSEQLWNRFAGNQIWNSTFINGWNEANGSGTTESLNGNQFIYNHSGSGAASTLSGGSATLDGGITSWSTINDGDWTFETNLKFNPDELPNGFTLWLGVGSDRIVIELYNDRSQDSGADTFQSYHTNDDGQFHTFRVSHDSSAGVYHLWRDGKRLTPLGGAPYDSSDNDDRMLLGDTTSKGFGNNFIVEIDYIAFDQTGAYNPPPNLEVDTDNDGIADAWEYIHFNNLTNVTDTDTDGDGRTLYQEYIADTNPMDGTSHFELKETSNPDSDKLLLTISQTSSQRNYTLQHSNDMGINDPWKTVHEHSGMNGTDGPLTLNVDSPPVGFFRVIIEIPE